MTTSDDLPASLTVPYLVGKAGSYKDEAATAVVEDPKEGRAKNWLWVHDRYRTQATAFLDLKEDPSKQMAAFAKFHKKLESHSEFEDTQLFKFFVDAKIGNQDTLEELQKQHGNIRLVSEITEGLDKMVAGSASDEEKAATQEKLEAYVKDLMAHLDLEEKTITGPWMQLTPEQYKTYRSYLSWMYWFMY
ncbi:expressed unknown protein [Seminavis robusta]|uniref:Hemerythrin-like domain-containing protein n=1 Tax=Seminavis robusta TaxID=568900 RepID=A0A9N8HFW8_9STRA|nr:expressed unknown protein [Seminavis robusta]|eukprot:Sro544_g163710.1 n/a (190) ;mRNA; r:52145-52838